MSLETIQELNIQEVLDRAEDAGVVSVGNFIETISHISAQVHRKCFLSGANVMVINPNVKVLKHFPKEYKHCYTEYELRMMETKYKHTSVKNGERCRTFNDRYLVVVCEDMPENIILLGRISTGIIAKDTTGSTELPSYDIGISTDREFLVGNISYAHTLRLEEEQ